MPGLNTRYSIFREYRSQQGCQSGMSNDDGACHGPRDGNKCDSRQRIQGAVLPISRGRLLRSKFPVYTRKASRITRGPMHANSRKNRILPHFIRSNRPKPRSKVALQHKPDDKAQVHSLPPAVRGFPRKQKKTTKKTRLGLRGLRGAWRRGGNAAKIPEVH